MKSNDDISSGTNISYWLDSFRESMTFTKVIENLQTEVVIVGGGIAGISIAYELSKRNIPVVLVEDGNIGSGETGRTTAHLVTALDDRYYDLQKVYGEENAKMIFQSHRDAIDYVERVVDAESIDCDFSRVNGYLFLHPSDKEDSLEKEFEACQNIGMNVKMVDEIPGTSDRKSKAIEFADQAQFHPMKYVFGLCEAIIRNGGKIFTRTHAQEITKDGIVTDDKFAITAKHVVVATNTPVNNRFVMHLKQFAYRTYVIALLVKKGLIPKNLWWDTGDFEANSNIPPYHYVRTQEYDEQNDLVICGGEDHPVGLPDTDDVGLKESDHYDFLYSWYRKYFPEAKIVYKWSGQVMEPMDSLAYIGNNPLDKDNIYIVTGDSGNGMTHGTIAAMLIPDLIEKKENKYKDLYSPSRFKVFKKGSVMFKEFAGGFIAYLKNKPKHSELKEFSEIKKGEGKVIEFEKNKYGVYVDEYNVLHFVSAECTHLGCILNWNNDEKSWDCPCHGSRFDHLGKVLNGPANSPLKYFDESDIG